MIIEFKTDFLNRKMISPFYEGDLNVGLNIQWNGEEGDSIYIYPFNGVKLPTGLYIKLPIGFEFQIRPRNELAENHGITVIAPATIDSGSLGEINVSLFNLGHEPFKVNAGDCIAQMVLSSVLRATPWERD